MWMDAGAQQGGVMNNIWTSMDAWPTVKALVPDMPDHTKRLVLIFEPDKAVIAQVEYYPDIQKPETVKEIFKLVPVD